jgi:bifunctional NMN adenylyltransferase/nudix hydrolase
MNASNTPCDAAVYIGRFQPFHLGHAALLREALALSSLCVVVIGSAFQARSPKNPFTWQERAEMIRLTLPENERNRLRFVPLRDYYNEARWCAAVRDGVAAVLASESTGAPTTRHQIALVGHFKDATSDYLRGFPGWALHSVERRHPIDATSVRDALFAAAGQDVDAALAALVESLPSSSKVFLRAWAELPLFAELAQEWQMLRRYRQAWAAAPYPPVFVTVDTVIRCAGHVLLVQRGQAPGKGLMAVPGGFIEQRETAYQSALRELQEETHLTLLADTMRHALKEVAVFDHPDRSQRGRTITHAHYFDLGERELPEVKAGDDAAQAKWVPIAELAAMEDRFMDDHFHMLDHFLALTGESAATGG